MNFNDIYKRYRLAAYALAFLMLLFGIRHAWAEDAQAVNDEAAKKKKKQEQRADEATKKAEEEQKKLLEPPRDDRLKDI
jgi:hypothetical protein